MDVVAAVLLRPKDEKFNADLFQERRKLFGEVPVTELIGMVNFFSNGGRHSIQNIKDCLIIPMMGNTKKKRLKRILWSIINGFQWLTNLQSRILQKMRQSINITTLQPSTD